MIDQHVFAAPPADPRFEDCLFYHSMEIPGHGPVEGYWDLRGSEDAHLGGVELEGRRVLEIGPASGFLTFHMESRGAEVTAVELAPGGDWDVVPHVDVDVDVTRAGQRATMDRVRNGYWFAHRRFGSRARVHYGSVYAVPEELGHFDVVVLGAVLLHTRDPLRILESLSRRADRVVICETHIPEIDGAPVMRFFPTPESAQWDTWWHFSPEFFEQALGVLGFDDIAVTRHVERHISDGQVYEMPMFTVVAQATRLG
jgi:SAM-dependent methyltransferase